MADHIIHNLPQPLPLHLAGAKFRPCRWSDLSDRTKPDTWGIECKPAGKRHYRPVGWQMKANPFATKDEAAALCNQLNAAAAGVGGPDHQTFRASHADGSSSETGQQGNGNG